MSHPRGLSAEEAELWERVAATVKPLHPARKPAAPSARPEQAKPLVAKPKAAPLRTASPRPVPPARPQAQPPVPPISASDRQGLDSHWDRKLKAGSIAPDFTLDLHGHTLDSAHDRLDHGLMQAKAMGARLVLLVTGKPRPVEAADRGERRGAIRAKILDWLAAGPHGQDIAAVRGAHRRHGGQGALYLVLKRRR
ncbi:MAG: Smr/MutS family protein [Sphingomonadaceae bacterium]|nr:Smr/MutS family protein [Sphingomonadaceae bacterium]